MNNELYSTSVDTSSEKDMRRYLGDHFTYYTMNSWNQTVSWANRVKLRYLGLTSQQLDVAYEVISNSNEWWTDILPELTTAYAERHKYKYQIGFNGRSGGYIVLYLGDCDTLPYFKKDAFGEDNKRLAYCQRYERWFSYDEAEGLDLIGKTYRRSHIKAGVSPVPEDVYALDKDELVELCSVLQEFDKCCNEIVGRFKRYCDSVEVVEGVEVVEREVTMFIQKTSEDVVK